MEKTLTQILEEVKEEICDNYCKFSKQCAELLENDEADSIVCPLDRL